MNQIVNFDEWKNWYPALKDENISVVRNKASADYISSITLKNKNVRQIGTVIAFEICTADKDDYLNAVSQSFSPFCMQRGVYLRSMGNTIYIMPPYCITSRELKKIYSVVTDFIYYHLN